MSFSSGARARLIARAMCHAKRAVHAKENGMLIGEFEELADLRPMLAQGLFATPQTYFAVLRLSTIPDDVLDDAVSVPRGTSGPCRSRDASVVWPEEGSPYRSVARLRIRLPVKTGTLLS